MGDNPTGHQSDQGILTRLVHTRKSVWLVLLIERVWPLLLPLLILLSLFFSFSWLGIFRIVPDWLRLTLLALFAFGTLVAFSRLRYFLMPQRNEIDRRIESSNHLAHAPVSAQTETISLSSDPFAQVLWQEHQKRMAKRLSNLQTDLPRTRVTELDPFAMRAAVALLFVIAAAYSFSPYRGHVTDAFQSRTMTATAPKVRIDAWITPPTYTRRAPIFLTGNGNEQLNQVDVPEGSVLSIRLNQGSGQERLHVFSKEGERDQSPELQENSDRGALSFSHIFTDNTTISLKDGYETLLSWQFNVIIDTPPLIRLTEDPRRTVSGALELTYEIIDDYPAVRAWADFELAYDLPESAKPLVEAPELTLVLPRKSADNHTAKTLRDLTEHPWAGLEVILTLSVDDASEQAGVSEPTVFLMPQRNFTNSLSRALIEQRQILALNAYQKRHVLNLMDAVLLWADETIALPTQFLLVSAIRSKLALARTYAELSSVVDELWQVALIIEDGALSAAERRLRNAQENLRQALENNAPDQELKALMEELRTAMSEFLREFAERAMRNQNFADQLSPNDQMTAIDIEQMLNQLEELTRSGAKDEAQQLLSQLEQMMNNLQAGRQQPGEQQSEMQQQMNQLGNILRQQQEILNETYRLNHQGGGQGEKAMKQEELDEALRNLQERQNALADELNTLKQDMKDQSIKPNEGLNEAGEAMGLSSKALGDKDTATAAIEQGNAIEALRRGAQQMMNEMRQAMQDSPGENGQSSRNMGMRRDPLGRPRSNSGSGTNDTVTIPDEIDRQQARQILDAIRRRLGNALSPELEQQYLERLLELD